MDESFLHIEKETLDMHLKFFHIASYFLCPSGCFPGSWKEVLHMKQSCLHMERVLLHSSSAAEHMEIDFLRTSKVFFHMSIDFSYMPEAA